MFKFLTTEELQHKAQQLRKIILQMIAYSGSGHPGSSLSIIDILTCLYYKHMNYEFENKSNNRDRFILSKGHGVPALYAILIDLGVVPAKFLTELRKINSPFQGHPDKRYTRGIEVSSGSLGQGLSIGLGLALSNRLLGISSKVYVLLGDGECQEGQIWEAAMFAGHSNINNLVAIVDWNGLQHDGSTDSIVNLTPFEEKWESFGWEVLKIDGHDINQINLALEKPCQKPKVILAKTIKGKGVDYMENDFMWHSVADSEKMKIDFL